MCIPGEFRVILLVEVQNLHDLNFHETNASILLKLCSILCSSSILLVCLLLMLFNIVMGIEAHLLLSDFSEAGTPTLNPEVTSEINSNFENDMIPKKKPQYWDIKF